MAAHAQMNANPNVEAIEAITTATIAQAVNEPAFEMSVNETEIAATASLAAKSANDAKFHSHTAEETITHSNTHADRATQSYAAAETSQDETSFMARSEDGAQNLKASEQLYISHTVATSNAATSSAQEASLSQAAKIQHTVFEEVMTQRLVVEELEIKTTELAKQDAKRANAILEDQPRPQPENQPTPEMLAQMGMTSPKMG